MAKKKQGFVYGALILMLSNIIVKVIGALFKIPLANIIGDTAMGFFNSAYSIYSMFFLISTAGLPVAISRMIAAAKAKNNYKEASKIYNVSLTIFIVIGLLGTCILFFGATKIAEFPGEPELVSCIKAIAPIMFFICISSCIRGYFQGSQNMTPTAISQVIEVLGNLFIGLTLGIWSSKKGYAPPMVAAFVIIGVTLGVVLSSIYLLFAKKIAVRDEKTLLIDAMAARPAKKIALELLRIAIPITIASSMLSLTSVIDSMVAVRRLKEVGISFSPRSAADTCEKIAISIYGAYTSKAVTIFNLPPTIIYPFAISIIPAISGMKEIEDKSKVNEIMTFTFKIVSVICMPCTLGICALSKPIIRLLFSANNLLYVNTSGVEIYSNDIAAPMLSILSIAIIFSGLISVSGAMLQAYGFERLSIVSTACGVLAKLLAVYFLIGSPLGVYGIAISTLLCYTIMFTFNMFFIYFRIGYKIDFIKIIFKPLIASCACAGTALLCYKVFSSFISFRIATILGILCGALIYLILVFIMRIVNESDILQLPKGDMLLKISKKLKLI